MGHACVEVLKAAINDDLANIVCLRKIILEICIN